MPKLIQNITASVLDHYTGETIFIKSVLGEIGDSDYIKVYGLEAFLQDYSRAQEVEELTKPLTFGLKNNGDFILLEISY